MLKLTALNLTDTAALVGRSADWLRENWHDISKALKFPPPIHEAGTLVWDRAQVYAWLDRDRPMRERAFAAAFRAAYDAASASDADLDDTVAASRRELDRRRRERQGHTP